jgi:dihydrodipicolinate synthase/N-acetylneuraminate lyase
MQANLTAQRIRGVLPALPTPFTDDGKVDARGLEKLVAHVLDGGVHGLWVLGSSGEFTALSPEERKQVVDVIVGATQRRVPVLVGLGSNDVREIIRSAEQAHRAGADACFALLPFYFVADPREAIAFFRRIAEASPLPVVIYDNPFSTKTKLEAGTYLELVDCPNIIALKDSSSDFVRFQALLAALRANTPWRVLQGDERLVGASVLLGADGTVAALASVAPRLFVRLYEASAACKAQETAALQRRAMALGKLFELKGQPTDGAFFAGLKAGLQVLGICGGQVSSPFSPMPADKMPLVENLLREFEEFL